MRILKVGFERKKTTVGTNLGSGIEAAAHLPLMFPAKGQLLLVYC